MDEKLIMEKDEDLRRFLIEYGSTPVQSDEARQHTAQGEAMAKILGQSDHDLIFMFNEVHRIYEEGLRLKIAELFVTNAALEKRISSLEDRLREGV